MKQIVITIITFAIAFATSLLLDLEFIAKNQVRYILVILFIVAQLIIGFNVVKVVTLKKQTK